MRPRLGGLFATLLVACTDPGAAAPPSCVRGEAHLSLSQNGIDALDVLFVIDDSPAMQARASSLVRVLGGVGEALVHPTPGVVTYETVQLAVVSADLGTPGATVAGCTAEGDDGRPDVGACATARGGLPPFLLFDNEADTHPWSAADFACAADLGAAGCSVQQPLEAARRALAGTPGFVRSDAVLAVVVIAGADDASVRDCRHAEAGAACDDATSVFDLANPRWTGATLAVRLTDFADGSAQDPTWPLDRYMDPRQPTRGFTGLKPNRPENVLFIAAAPLPIDLPRRPNQVDVDWDALLASGDHLPRRLINTVRRFADTYYTGSIYSLDGDLTELTRPIVERLAQRLVGRCLPRLLPTHAAPPCCDPAGAPAGCATAPTCTNPAAVTVQCTVTERLDPSDDPSTWCTPAHGRRRVPDIDGRATCAVDQLAAVPGSAPPAGTHGFYYDTAVDPTNPSCASRITFTRGDRLRTGSEATIDCALAAADGC